MRQVGRLVALVVICLVALQLYFVLRVALMAVVDPQSTSFQRSEARRLLGEHGRIEWSQQWVPYDRIAPSLKRAVIASEDAGFADHGGVDWEAIEKAWDRNLRAQERAEKLNQQLQQRQARAAAKSGKADAPAPPAKPPAQARIVGGSTITQQLAKNLFLSAERTTLRKGQELAITYMLEALLGKQRILEIYLNNVEWGEGLFGAQAAARHYFRADAAQLGTAQAARLAVMLPAPKRFEKRPSSPYIVGRAGTVAARMGAVDLP
jgi:monofunctional biosynthetic peptidoglycan transglycosylase